MVHPPRAYRPAKASRRQNSCLGSRTLVTAHARASTNKDVEGRAQRATATSAQRNAGGDEVVAQKGMGGSGAEDLSGSAAALRLTPCLSLFPLATGVHS
jgi:hypothetical protein